MCTWLFQIWKCWRKTFAVNNYNNDLGSSCCFSCEIFLEPPFGVQANTVSQNLRNEMHCQNRQTGDPCQHTAMSSRHSFTTPSNLSNSGHGGAHHAEKDEGKEANGACRALVGVQMLLSPPRTSLACLAAPLSRRLVALQAEFWSPARQTCWAPHSRRKA